jgi:TRAP transporter 4TM/12TM fusion protein
LWGALWAGVGVVGFILTFRRTDLLTWGLGVATTVLLAALLVMRIEPSMAAFWALIAVIGVGVFYKESKMRIPDIMNTLEWGTKNALAIGAACACVGFIVGATTLTGLGLKFAAAVIQLAQGTAGLVQTVDVTHLLTLEPITLFFTLVYTAVACFILGMGIPTTAQYIIASMIAAPALLKWGIPPLCSHMFVLFYAVLADVTPPVALAAYAASGVSGADPFRTGFTAFGLSSAELYVPFAFVYSPILLWLPKILDPKASFNFVEFALVLTTIVLGVVALGSTSVGYLREKSTVPERVATGVSAFALLIHEVYSSLIGAAILLVVYALQRLRARKRALAKQGASG